MTQEEANELIQKAIDTTLLAQGGQMNPDQADKFVDLTVDESILLKQGCRIIKTDNPKGEIDKLNIGEPVTEKATENSESTLVYSSTPTQTQGYLYDPTLSKIEYTCIKTRSAFNITKEALQSNIEKEELRDTLMRSFAKRMSTDLEYLGIMGDPTTYAASFTKVGRLLKANHGWYRISMGDLAPSPPAAHIIQVGGKNVSKYLFSKMIKTLPKKYLMAFDSYRFYVSPTIYQNFIEQLSERSTNLGDAALSGKITLTAYGVPIIRVPLIGESIDCTAGTVEVEDGTFIFLVVPENLIAVFLRKFDVYWEFKPRADRWENTTYSQTDFQIENTDAMVVANCVSPSSCEEYNPCDREIVRI